MRDGAGNVLQALAECLCKDGRIGSSHHDAQHVQQRGVAGAAAQQPQLCARVLWPQRIQAGSCLCMRMEGATRQPSHHVAHRFSHK
jgi:hypothetical protein